MKTGPMHIGVVRPHLVEDSPHLERRGVLLSSLEQALLHNRVVRPHLVEASPRDERLWGHAVSLGRPNALA